MFFTSKTEKTFLLKKTFVYKCRILLIDCNLILYNLASGLITGFSWIPGLSRCSLRLWRIILCILTHSKVTSAVILNCNVVFLVGVVRFKSARKLVCSRLCCSGNTIWHVWHQLFDLRRKQVLRIQEISVLVDEFAY